MCRPTQPFDCYGPLSRRKVTVGDIFKIRARFEEVLTPLKYEQDLKKYEPTIVLPQILLVFQGCIKKRVFNTFDIGVLHLACQVNFPTPLRTN